MKKNTSKGELAKRYLVFLIGLFINSLGVSLITKANLGTSPISSIPYVLSLNFPFSLGQFTIFFSILLIVLQLLILRKNFKVESLLQIPVSLAFGYFIDLCMALLFFIHPQAYVLKILYLLIGCVILGIGVYMEVLADVIMLPGESFVRAVVFQWKTEFGSTKIVFDVSMSVIAAVLSLVLAKRLDGVREGTVIAALLVGFIARTIGRQLSFLPGVLFGTAKPTEASAETAPAEQPICIAVGRQYGSGGRILARKLAEKLSFSFYDEEIIQMAAGSTGFSSEYISKQEETMTNSLLYDLVNQVYGYSSDEHMPAKDQLFEAESKIIQDAAQENSVIVGRCADWVLRNNPRCIRVFLSAPMKNRIQTVMQREGLNEKDAKRRIQQVDKQRADNYRYYTRHIWGMASNYNLCIDTSLGEEYVQSLILDLVEQVKQGGKMAAQC